MSSWHNTLRRRIMWNIILRRRARPAAGTPRVSGAAADRDGPWLLRWRWGKGDGDDVDKRSRRVCLTRWRPISGNLIFVRNAVQIDRAGLPARSPFHKARDHPESRESGLRGTRKCDVAADGMTRCGWIVAKINDSRLSDCGMIIL